MLISSWWFRLGIGCPRVLQSRCSFLCHCRSLLWAEGCQSPCSAGFPGGPGELAGLDVCGNTLAHLGNTREREVEVKCKYVQRL